MADRWVVQKRRRPSNPEERTSQLLSCGSLKLHTDEDIDNEEKREGIETARRVKATWEGQGADRERGKGKRWSLTGQGRRREVTLTAPCGTAR